MGKYDLLEILQHISPATLDYQEWVNVGMALKHEGYTAMDWDNWSRSDSRYHKGECYKKWDSFHGSNVPVTAGTIVQMAKDNGWAPAYFERDSGHELEWDSAIGSKDDLVVIKKGWVEGREVHE